ncbi:MAG: ATP-dependent DNA helicase RecG [Pseudomonadota bacterium]
MRPQILNPIFADVTALAGVGPKVATLLQRIAGPRVVDLLFTPPTGLIDRSFRPTIAAAPDNQRATILVTVDKHEPAPRGRRAPYKVLCSDETGFLTLVFFHARADYLQKVLPVGENRIVSGKVEDFGGARQMAHPEHIADPTIPNAMPLHEPVYPLTAGLAGGVMRRSVSEALKRAPVLPEWQDPSFIVANKWTAWEEALRGMHTPEGVADLTPASPERSRLAYDELLANQLALILVRRARARDRGRPINGDGKLRALVSSALPFSLTDAQQAALKDILADKDKPERMARLVQGDVGSGKTVVALLSMLNAVETGAQAVLMAPTEILARQHLDGLRELARPANIDIEILTGRDTGLARKEKLDRIRSGRSSIVIGTHALFQTEVEFADLAFVVIDEQHRFGVRQRVSLMSKGARPDLLVLTATPIPRTLALTAYGDMELSQIREKPPGRKPISTRTVSMDRLDEVAEGVKRAVESGDQVYWVCPMVEDSEEIDLTSAQFRHEAMAAQLGERVGLVHGRMTGGEKDAVMERFYSGELRVLIATTVIEVGVDAPDATIMIIEHAERFGLAQLHQLRGRVGRGDKRSSCVLLYKAPLSETAAARLKILRDTEDGFLIAEEDLRLRGAGDLLGAAQSGAPQFRIADLSQHQDLLAAAHDDAKLIVQRDPELNSVRGRALRVLLYLFSRDEVVGLLRAG